MLKLSHFVLGLSKTEMRSEYSDLNDISVHISLGPVEIDVVMFCK